MITGSSDNVLSRVAETMARYGMLGDGPILVAVSGGPDSVCLLHVLQALGETVVIAHIDHSTRDGGSADDARWVHALADTLGLECVVTVVNVTEHAQATGQSFQEAARELRYGVLVEEARRLGCRAIATGHHRDDVAETVLMRTLRGTSPQGLSAIPAVGSHGGVRVYRPLIDVSRADIMAYLTENALEFCTDESNASTAYDRNAVRLNLLPLLERDYNPNVREALARIAETHQVENDLLSTLASDFRAKCFIDSTIERVLFREGHPAVQRRLLAGLATELGANADHARLVKAVDFIVSGDTGKRMDLGNGVQLVNGREQTEIVRDPEPRVSAAPCPLPLGEAQTYLSRSVCAHASTLDTEISVRDFCSPRRQVLDAIACEQGLQVRTPVPGDRFVPLGMTGSKKVSDYLSDIGLPVWERDEQLLIVSGDKILWVVGHAMSALAAVTDDTKDIVVVEVSDASEC